MSRWLIFATLAFSAPSRRDAAGEHGHRQWHDHRRVEVGIPGVTVTATDHQTGRQYVGVSDDRGIYRLVNMPPGTYRMQAELPSFATVGFRTSNCWWGRTRPWRRPQGRRARGDTDGDGRVAAGGHRVVAGRRQHRPPPDGGAAAAGPQLDGAVADGQGHHREQHRQHAGRLATISSSSISTASRSRSASPARASASPR